MPFAPSEGTPVAKAEAVDKLGVLGTPDNALDRLEHELTPTGAALTFMAAVVIMVCGAFAYVVTGAKVKELFDYLAYVSPCIAALAVSLTIYFDRYKGTLFAFSIIFLSLGLEMFAASKENDAVPVGVISVVAMIAKNLAITLLRLRSSDQSLALWKAGKSTIASTIVGSALALIALYFVTVYVTSFFFHNLHCLKPTLDPACEQIWKWW